jgi:hypothetical protein
MVVPETDLARIRRFCEEQVPPDMRDQVRVEHRVRGQTVTIVEHRPPWNPALGPDRTDTPQARMKYDEQTKGWTCTGSTGTPEPTSTTCSSPISR